MIDRIKQLLDWQQLSPTQFADRIGVGRPVVSHILSERNKPSLEVVQRIIAAFPDLSLPWLLSGSGAMLAAPPQVAATSLVAAATAAPAVALPVTSPLSTQRQDPTATATPAPAPGRPIGSISAPPSVSSQQAAFAAAGPARFRAEAATAAGAAATRFVASRAKPTSAKPPVEEPVAAATQEPLAASEFLLAQVPNSGPFITGAQVAATAPTASPPALVESAALAQALGESLGTPGKTIRRIVLFYTDGSFADYKPE